MKRQPRRRQDPPETPASCRYDAGMAPPGFVGRHHVQMGIPPGGEGTARAFYGDVLGMTEVDKPAALGTRGGCWFRAGGWEVHLGVEEGFRPARRAHPAVLVRSLDRLAERLASAGVAVDWDARLPGYTRFYTYDPHGNRLEFLEPG